MDEDTWRRVRAILTDPSRGRQSPDYSYLLTRGLAVCAECGADLVAKQQNGGRPGMGVSDPIPLLRVRPGLYVR